MSQGGDKISCMLYEEMHDMAHGFLILNSVLYLYRGSPLKISKKCIINFYWLIHYELILLLLMINTFLFIFLILIM